MDRMLVVGMLLVAACSADTDNVDSVQQEAYCNCNSNPLPCCCETPIVLDIAGDGLELTTWREGVVFALRPSRPIGPWAWTHPGSDDAWLVLDNDDDGVITNGTELFGEFTAQPKAPDGEERNGFLALAQYDSNGDRVVDEQDNVFDELRLWQDKNHDGISQPEELHVLPELGVAGLSVDYASIREPDGQGNVLRYSAPVHVTPGSSVGMTAWDVMLTSPYASEWNYGAPRIEEPPEEQTTGIGSTGVGQEFASGAEKGSRGVAEKGGGQFWLHGDRVYKLVSGTSWAIGQGWWTKDMEVIATQADVRVRLQHYFNGVWVTVGTSPPVPRRMAASVHEDLPPPPHLRAENGQVCTYN